MRLVASMVSATSRISRKGSKRSRRALIPLPGDLVQRKIDAQLGIAEGGNKNWHVVLESGFQNPSSLRRFVQILARAPVNLPAARGVFRVPCVEKCGPSLLRRDRDSFPARASRTRVVPGVEKLLVAHIGVVTEMRVTGGFYQSMRHERAGRDDGPDDARFNQIAKNQPHLANSQRAR